jgi:TM2 domain-containing membrane protein YozV
LGAYRCGIFVKQFLVKNKKLFFIRNLYISNIINQIKKAKKTMEAQKVDMFMMMNVKFFESHHVPFIREKLLSLDESKWGIIQSLQFKDPTTSLIVSLLGGGLGIDRFMIGDTGMGVGKLLTCGGLGIWTIIDWFMIMGATREKNMETFQNSLY